MNKCPKGSYYCYTDKKCKPIPKGMKTTADFLVGEENLRKLVLTSHLTVATAMATAMVMAVEMEADLVKEVFISGLKDPNQKMVKVVGSTLSLVAHVLQ